MLLLPSHLRSSVARVILDFQPAALVPVVVTVAIASHLAGTVV